MIIPIYILGLIISGAALYHENWALPKWINWLILPSALITFTKLPASLFTNRILDIAHPIYTDGGLSTLSILICLSNGIIIAGTAALIYRSFYEIRAIIRKKKKERK